MKKALCFLLFVALLLCLVGCDKAVLWNGKTAELGNLYMVVDFTNKCEYVGMVDYVFVGTVEEIIDDVLPDKIKSNTDGYSSYKIHVDKNMKGNLAEEIICAKLGGFKKDGTMYLVAAETPNGQAVFDNGLPELNRQYIFLAYAQPDGSLTLSEIFDNREYSEELFSEYTEYINNQIVYDRERFASKYDIS